MSGSENCCRLGRRCLGGTDVELSTNQGLFEMYKVVNNQLLLGTTALTWPQRLAMMRTLLNSLLLTALKFQAEYHTVSQPRVQLGHTTLIGSSLQPANVEFFGGYRYLILIRYHPHLNSQASPMSILQSVAFALLLQNPSIRFLP